MIKHGSLQICPQADAELVYQSDGLITGTIVFIGDKSDINRAFSKLGTSHPLDSSVTLYALHTRRLKLERLQFTFDCIGLAKDPTDRIAQLMPSVSTNEIQTHPKFVTDLAGTPASPLNGAYFDGTTGEFVGFMGGNVDANKRLGLRSYYTGACVVRSTHYSRTPPRFSEACKIKSTLPGIPEIHGVRNYLYMPPGYDPIPGTRINKVTEEWLGSSGPDGWDPLVYQS